MKIFKYYLPVRQTSVLVEMPSDAKVLSCGNQRGQLVVWCAVSPLNRMVQRRFTVVPTGDAEPNGVFIGTAQFDSGWYALHVFDGGEV